MRPNLSGWSMGDRDAHNREWQKIRAENEKQTRKAEKRRAYRARKRLRDKEKE